MKTSIIIRVFLLISLLIIPVCIGNVLFASSNYQDKTYQQALEEEKRLKKVLEDAIKSGNRKKIEEAKRMIEKHRRVAEQARRELALKEKLRTERLMHENRMAQMSASKMRAESGMKESMMGARKELALKEKAMMREQMLKERQISERKMVEQKLKASRMTESQMRMKSITEQTQIRGTRTPARSKPSLGGAKDVLSASDFRSTTNRLSTGTGTIASPSVVSKSSSKIDRTPSRRQNPGSRTPAPTPTVVQRIPSMQPFPAVSIKKVSTQKIPLSVSGTEGVLAKGTKIEAPEKAIADSPTPQQMHAIEASSIKASQEKRSPDALRPDQIAHRALFGDRGTRITSGSSVSGGGAPQASPQASAQASSRTRIAAPGGKPVTLAPPPQGTAPRDLVEQYARAVASRDPVKIKSAWAKVDQNYSAVRLMEKEAPKLAAHLKQRGGIEEINAGHRAQAAAGEIKPFSEMEGEMFNKKMKQAPRLKKVVPTKLDPKTMDKIFLENKHVDFYDPKAPKKPVGSQKLADVVKETQRKQLAHKQQELKAKQAGEANTKLKNDARPGKRTPKEFAGKAIGTTLDVVGTLGLAATGVRKEAEDAAKERREFSKFKALENVGKNVIHGTTISPFETGRRAAQEEIKRLPEYEKEVRAGLKANGLLEGMTKAEQDVMVRTVAQHRAQTVAAGKALKGVFYDAPQKMSRSILEEEALKEFKEAKVAGEGNKLSMKRTAKYKLRAAGRIAGELTLINPLMDALTYDSDADRRAAEMQHRLQEYTKSKMLDGLTKTTRISAEIEQLTSSGDLNDPATQERLQKLQEQYNTTLSKVKKVDERMKNKVDPNDPMIAALQNAVRKIPKGSVIQKKGESIPDEGTSTGDRETKPGEEGITQGETVSPPEAVTTKGKVGSTTDDLTQKQPSKNNEQQPTEEENQYVSVSGDELYGGPVSKTKVKVKAESVGGAELYGGPVSKSKPGDAIDALRSADNEGGKGSQPTPEMIALALKTNTVGSTMKRHADQVNVEHKNVVETSLISLEKKRAGAQTQGNREQNKISKGELNLDHSITQVKLAEETAEATAEAERNQRAEARDAIASTFTRVIATPFDTGGRILGTGTAKHSTGIKPSHTDGSSSHGASGSSSGDNRSGTHGTGNSGNTHSSPLQGTISGSWSGSDWSGSNMSGSFTMHISAGGAVTGSYSGSSSGSLSGNVGPSGNVRAASGSATGEESATWTGSIRRDSNGRSSGSGSWDSSFASGGWSGGGS